MKISPPQIPLKQAVDSHATGLTKGGETLEAKKLRLKKATREFESFFILHMLKAMRQTIPKSGLLEEGLGQNVYTSMFDEELAKRISSSSSTRGLADVLYRSLEKSLEAETVGPNGELNAPVKVNTSITTESRSLPGTITPAVRKAAKDDAAGRTNDVIPIAIQNEKPKITTDPVLSQFGDSISQASKQFKIDPRLIYSVIMAESGGNPAAVSAKGAKGLMQLMDDTAAELGVSDSLNPEQNVAGGTKYLRQLLDKYDGDIRLALAAYNAGPGAVSKYNGVPPYDETRDYVDRVLARLHSF